MKPLGALLLAMLLVLPLACDRGFGKPKVGDTCSTQDQADCKDETTIVTCDQGKYIEYPCKGPAGCKKEGRARQMRRVARRPGRRLQPRRQLHLRLRPQRPARVQGAQVGDEQPLPRPPTSARPKDPYVKCDQTVAEVGDACENKAAACSVDGKSVLECAEKKFAAKQKCDTECEIKDRLVQCKAK